MAWLRKLAAKRWWAFDDDGSLKLAWFLKQTDMKKASAARDASDARPRTKMPAKLPKKVSKTNVQPSPRRTFWADNAETMEKTGATYDQLNYWKRDGFPAPDRRLPLRRKRVRVKGSRGLGKAFNWRAHVDAIQKWQEKLRPAEDQETDSSYKDKEGTVWQRHRKMLKEFKCNDSTARKWAMKCPMLGNAPFVRKKIPSKHHFRAEEWGYRDDLYQKALAARRLTKDEADKQDFFVDEKGERYVPLHIALGFADFGALQRNSGPSPDKPIHTRKEVLPYRPDRGKVEAQEVYNLKHLQAHKERWGNRSEVFKNWPRGERGKLLSLPPVASSNGNGQQGSSASGDDTRSAVERTKKSGANKNGRPTIKGRRRERRVEIVEGWLNAKLAKTSREDYCKDNGINVGKLRAWLSWYATQPEASSRRPIS